MVDTQREGHVSIGLVLAIAALGCAVLLLFQVASKLWPIIAAVVAGIQLLIAFGVMHLSISGVPLGTLLGVALAVSGIASWLKVSNKMHASAATVIALVGLVQAATGLLRY